MSRIRPETLKQGLCRIEAKLKKQAIRYEKNYPGELLHLDTKRLPWLKGEGKWYESEREYLFVAIDDFSRELYAGIYPDKSSWSAASFLKAVLRECPYTIGRILTDNGTEYKGRYGEHDFMRTCGEAGIKQSPHAQDQRQGRTDHPDAHGAVVCQRTLRRPPHA